MGKVVSWLIGGSEGTNFADNVSLFLLKFTYLGLRILLRLALGKRKRDEFYVKNNLDFGAFWYKFYQSRAALATRSGKVRLLRFKVPKYGYQFYCRINKDDFKLMTVHEDEIISRIAPDPGDTVIDVGAHIGLYTIIGSKRVGAEGRVIALEPHPDNRAMLERNVELNHLKNVIVLEYAASSAESPVRLYLPSGDQGYTKLNTIMPARAVTENFVEVTAKTLDSIATLLPIKRIDWIKIDVEGAELEVLEGAARILSKNAPIRLLIEVHHVQGKDLYSEILKFLEQFGFHLRFEKVYDNGERHVLFAKDDNLERQNRK